jgi:hypothetical protein
MNNFDNLDADRDLAKNREVYLEDGSKMYIRQNDQYGFWNIVNGKGRVADVLSGSYTTFDQALNALNNYATNTLKKPIKEVNRGYGIVTNKNGQLVSQV